MGAQIGGVGGARAIALLPPSHQLLEERDLWRSWPEDEGRVVRVLDRRHPAGSEHPAHLAQRTARITDVLDDEVGDGHVEASIRERNLVNRSFFEPGEGRVSIIAR